jgi:hypothetical protein
VQAEDKQFDHAIASISKPLRTRLTRHHRLRHELIAAALRSYRSAVPSTFRLGILNVVPDRDCFEISETRLTASLMNDDAWEDDDYHEPGVALCRFALSLQKGRLRERWTPRALVSFHALSRMIERSGLRERGQFMRELAVLLTAGDDGDEIATPGGGFWIGPVIAMKGKDGATRARSVRTWHF